MRARPRAADDLVKPDANVPQLLTAHPIKLSTLLTYRLHDRSVAVAPAVMPASPRAAMIRRDGITAHVATGSMVSASGTIAEQQVSAQPLLDELDRLIVFAWADDAAERTRAAAARAPNSTVASDVSHPSARSTVTATHDGAAQEAAFTLCPAQPTSTVVPEIVTDETLELSALIRLQQLDACLNRSRSPSRHASATLHPPTPAHPLAKRHRQ